jgi:hypothetical protein
MAALLVSLPGEGNVFAATASLLGRLWAKPWIQASWIK